MRCDIHREARLAGASRAATNSKVTLWPMALSCATRRRWPGGAEQADATFDTFAPRIDELLDPYEAAVNLLVTIPGAARRSA